jgi:hypothetical protein
MLPIGPSTRHYLPDVSSTTQYEAERRQSVQDIHRAGLDGGEGSLYLFHPRWLRAKPAALYAVRSQYCTKYARIDSPMKALWR